MSRLSTIINKFRNTNDLRGKLAIKNIIASFLIKGGSMLISFIIIPLTLGYLNEYEYGIWLTLSSVLSWIGLLDIGIGNGLRNKLTEAIAKKQYALGKIYVSTTYFYMTIIIVIFYISFILSQHYINWYDFFNVNPSKIPNLNAIILIVVTLTCVNFLLGIIGNIYRAYQLPAISDFITFIGSLFSLLIIYILTKTTSSSLMNIAITFTGVPIIIYLITYPITFKKFPQISPSLKKIKTKYFKDLITLGVNFLVIQITCVIVFMTSNIIISKLFGPASVTPYNIAYKYFTILNVGFTIILTPFWSAITDAFTKNDINWIKKINKKILLIWVLITILGLIMVIIAPIVYKIWIDDTIIIPTTLSILCFIYVTIQNWNNIFAYTINGIGYLRVSLICAIMQAIIYIPLAIYFSKLININGIVTALCVTLLISSIIQPIQYLKIIKGRTNGIWAK